MSFFASDKYPLEVSPSSLLIYEIKILKTKELRNVVREKLEEINNKSVLFCITKYFMIFAYKACYYNQFPYE